MTRRAAIWADSGPGVGLGHVARCCAVASELERLGVEVQVFTCGSEGVRAARDAGFTAAIADRLTAILDRGAGLAIVDSYRVPAADVDALRSAGAYVAAFDDTADRVLPADVVINGAPGAEAAHYDRQPGRHYLLGAAYFPLRPAFRDAPAKTIREVVEDVLVTVGGEDVHGLLGRVMTIAAESYARARIIGVIGSRRGSEVWSEGRRTRDLKTATVRLKPDTTDGLEAGSGTGLSDVSLDDAAREMPAGLPPDRCEVRQAPADYADLVRDADVIVCGGGQSLIEAAASGTPAAAIVLGDDQRPQRAAVSAAGAAADAGDWRLSPAERDARLRHALERMRPAEVRAHMSSRGRALVDGAGAQRIAKGILDAWQTA